MLTPHRKPLPRSKPWAPDPRSKLVLSRGGMAGRILALHAKLQQLNRQSRPQPIGEYLTITEAAALLKLSAKTVRNKISTGMFEDGVHFFQPPGGNPRFKRSALVAWLEHTTMPAASPAPVGRAFVGLGRVDRRRRRA